MPTRPSTTNDPLAQQMVELGDRLCREFAPADRVAADVVRGHVRQVRAAFGSPRILAFLPILIERAVRLCLSDDSRSRARAEDQGVPWSPPPTVPADPQPDVGRPATPDPVPPMTELADRLCREFAPAGGAAATDVRRQVHDVRAGLGSPKVVLFLSILVEHNVRGRLRADAHA